jgi:tight adherence protein B
MTLVIAALFSIALAALAFFGLQLLSATTQAYRAQFTRQARVSLAELFIFIEPEKLFVFQVAGMAVCFFLALLVSGSLVPAVMTAVIAGFLPNLAFRVLRRRRLDRVLMQLPDALIALAGSLKAGASLVQALELTVQEESPPIGQELELLLRELRVGVPFDQALDNLAGRAPAQDVRLVTAGMKISREVGGNLADVLDRLADTTRRRLEMEGKIRALTSQGKLQGVVMTMLPLLLGVVLYQMEPVHMARLFTEPLGWLALLAVSVFIGLGYFFIRKIVNIDV